MAEVIISHLWDVSIQAVIIFCVLFAVRGFFSLCKVPKKYAYALWGIFFFRLLLPIQPESDFGLMPQGNRIIEAISSWQEPQTGNISVVRHNEKVINSEEEVANVQTVEVPGTDTSQDMDRIVLSAQGTEEEAVLAEKAAEPEDMRLFSKLSANRLNCHILFILWLGGVTILLLCNAVSYGRLKKKVRCSIRLDMDEHYSLQNGKDARNEESAKNIYLADEVDIPFVMGLISPKIYLPSTIEAENLPYVIAHEQIHIQHKDYFLKLAAFFITGLYWFHPVVWLGFLFMTRDMEMSCDEAVMKKLGMESRGDYAQSLLLLSCGRGCPGGIPIAFSEGNIEGRIRHIMKYKKPLTATVVLAVVLIIILAAGLLTSPRSRSEEESRSDGQKVTSKESLPEVTSGDLTEEKSHAPEMKEETNSGIVLPTFSLDSQLGENDAVLDYVDENIVIFHGYFGLYVYSKEEERLIRSFTTATEEDFTERFEIFVEKNGHNIYLHSLMEDDIGSGETLSGFMLQVKTGKLWGVEYPIVNKEGTSGLFRNRIGEELFDVSQFGITDQDFPETTDYGYDVPEFLSYHCAVLGQGDEKTCCYLESVDGTLGGLVYVEQSRGSSKHNVKHVRVFGGQPLGSSSASYDNSTQINIDGVVYDMAERDFDINAIIDVDYGDGFWIVEGHIGPNAGCYSLFNTRTNSWDSDIYGTHFTWDRKSRRRPGNNLRETAVYCKNNEIYNYKGDLIAIVNLEEGEWIRDLSREGDIITIGVSSESGQERQLMFLYSESLHGIVTPEEVNSPIVVNPVKEHT